VPENDCKAALGLEKSYYQEEVGFGVEEWRAGRVDWGLD